MITKSLAGEYPVLPLPETTFDEFMAKLDERTPVERALQLYLWHAFPANYGFEALFPGKELPPLTNKDLELVRSAITRLLTGSPAATILGRERGGRPTGGDVLMAVRMAVAVEERMAKRGMSQSKAADDVVSTFVDAKSRTTVKAAHRQYKDHAAYCLEWLRQTHSPTPAEANRMRVSSALFEAQQRRAKNPG